MRAPNLTPLARDARNAALLAAEHDRTRLTRDAEVEYSETVAKLRERYQADLAEIARRRLEAVRPVHQAYNRAVAAAESAGEQDAEE